MTRRVRDEVGVDATQAEPAEPAMTGARQAIAEAHARRENHDLWRARESLRVLGEDRQRLADRVAELEQALGAMQQVCRINVELEAELDELKRAAGSFDPDIATNIERLHASAIDILVAYSAAPTEPLQRLAEATTKLADSLIAYARERRLAERASRPRRSSVLPTSAKNAEGQS